MKNAFYRLDDNQVSDISLKDIARRSRYGGIFYLFAFLGAVFSSVTAREHVYIIGFFSICFLILQVYRLVLFNKLSTTNEVTVSPYYTHYCVLYSASAIAWVGSSAWLFFVNPSIDLAVTINMMSAACLSIGGVNVLAPSYKILRPYCFLICVPFALAAGAFLEAPGNYTIACLILGYGLFIFGMGKQQHRAYWQALNDNLNLSAQAAELEKAKVAAECAAQAKADFLASMTHEIRTPMNGVLGMAQLLAMSDLNEQQKQQVNVINNAGRTLIHIINNILDYSKMDAKQLALEQLLFNPRDVVNEAVLLLSVQFEKKPIKLACIMDDIPEWVQGDPYRLHQVLYNLIGNAFKFTDEGEITIKVSCQKSHDEDTVTFIFTVSDTGIGIAPEYRQYIFDQFYQVNQFNSNIRGTGLGLSITQRLVEFMGGVISVESTLGVGSAFTVELPFTVTEDIKMGLSPVSGGESDIHTETLRILLAEDNKINQMICEQLLGKLGCVVDVVETGRGALEKFTENKHYDAIFMDCNMPDMDGFLATAAIRQVEKNTEGSETPIIALTAHVEEEVRHKCLESGMNDFLSKPFLLEDLEAIINRIRIAAFF
ncbi:Sensory/regulatory protein RpfC [Marinomonas spartinae]|uniref:Sensory/regulatory protein RpfC n=1 Tax=Marinomonas spartinae TaxID=1792290 RepID=A0A1A8T968_9GAMM|nr:Sensory/regulatory protein RpfC [Marinomonas spartinae]